MTYAKSHNRKVRKAKARRAAGLPLRKWELDRLARDENEVGRSDIAEAFEIVEAADAILKVDDFGAVRRAVLAGAAE